MLLCILWNAGAVETKQSSKTPAATLQGKLQIPSVDCVNKKWTAEEMISLITFFSFAQVIQTSLHGKSSRNALTKIP
jgi:hypothetical protein